MTTARETNRTTTVAVEYMIKDAPIVPRRYARQNFQPTFARVQYKNGQFNQLELVGLLVFSKGISQQPAVDKYHTWDREQPPSHMAWLWELIPAILDGQAPR